MSIKNPNFDDLIRVKRLDNMIKPIVYHSFEEKEALERELMPRIPLKRRRLISKALMDIFYNASRKKAKPQAKK